MCDSIPWRTLKNIKSFLYIYLIISVTIYISFHISSSHNPKTDSQQIQTNCSNRYKLIDRTRCLQTNLVVLKIEIST